MTTPTTARPVRRTTGIEWTDATWNPVVGCERVSPGCAHCYAKQLHDQRHRAHLEGKPIAKQYAQPFEVVQLKPERLYYPLSWRQPRRIFVNSVSDLFHDDVPDAFVDQVLAVIALSAAYGRGHVFQVLTKRPQRMRDYFAATPAEQWADRLAAAAFELPLGNYEDADCHVANSINGVLAEGRNAGWPLRNLWLGVSVENQRFADERIPLLLETPAAVRFLSCEPLLGPVRLDRLDIPVSGPGSSLPASPPAWRRIGPLDGFVGSVDHKGYCVGSVALPRIDWVIVGGESGNIEEARPMKAAWARALRDQCVAAGVAFFFKQWGEYAPLTFSDGSEEMGWFGRRTAGRELDGRTWDEMPGGAA